MLAIEPGGDDGGDEELRTVAMIISMSFFSEIDDVRVGTSIGHGEKTWFSVLLLEVLICEFLAVDGFATSTLYHVQLNSLLLLEKSYIATSEVTTLQHELRNDSVELAALVAEALLACAESAEVLGRLGDYIVVELEVDSCFLC